MKSGKSLGCRFKIVSMMSNLHFTNATTFPQTVVTSIVNASAKQQASLASGDLELGLKISLGALFVLAIIPGIFGNLLVILAITRTRLNHVNINLQVLSLATTDVLISSFPLPVLGTYFTFYWPQWMGSNGLCKATIYVVNLCASVSILTMTTIAIDRYFIVQKNRSLFSRRKCIITLALIWVAGALVAITNILNGGLHNEKLHSGTFAICNRISGKHIKDSSTKRSLIIKLLLGLPATIGLIIIYMRLSYSVWKRRSTPTDENSRSKNVRRANNVKIRALHMMFAVVVVFAICWIPYYVVTLLRIVQLTSSPHISPGAVLYSYTLAMLNSAINPLLYALLSKRFRSAFREIITGRPSRRIVRFSSGK